MCLAIPAEVIDVDLETSTAKVSISGIFKTVSLAFVENVVPGDYVLVHVGFALNKISAVEARKTLALFAEANVIEVEGANPDSDAPDSATVDSAGEKN